MPSSWRPAVWPVQREEADWGCSPRSWPKVAVRRRTAVRQASARALVQAAAVVGPASREARAARQRRAPPEAQASRAVLQPPAAEAVSPAVLPPPAVEALSRALPELSRRVAAPASARAPRRHNPRSEDRTERPRCALLDSNLTHRSQALPVADVPHLERSRSSESLRRAHHCPPTRALKPGSVQIRSQIREPAPGPGRRSKRRVSCQSRSIHGMPRHAAPMTMPTALRRGFSVH